MTNTQTIWNLNEILVYLDKLCLLNKIVTHHFPTILQVEEQSSIIQPVLPEKKGNIFCSTVTQSNENNPVFDVFIDSAPASDFLLNELKRVLGARSDAYEKQLKFTIDGCLEYNEKSKSRENSLLECDISILPFNINTPKIWLNNCIRGYRKILIKRKIPFRIIIYTSEDQLFPNLNDFADLSIEICTSPESCIEKVQNYANR